MAGVGAILPDWISVRPMPFDPREPIGGKESHIIEQLREMSASLSADLAVVAEYNRTWAGEILAETCGAGAVLAFDGPSGLNFTHRGICAALNVGSLDRWQTVHAEADTRETLKYSSFIDALGLDGKSFQPSLAIREEDRQAAKELWSTIGTRPDETVVCFPGSGDFARSLDADVWNRWINRLALTRPVVVLGSEADEPLINAICKSGLASSTRQITVAGENIGVTAAFLDMAQAYLGMDTGPMHIAAALGTPTLGVFGGGYRAERFLPVGRKTAAIRMPLGCYGCDWLCPFDRRHCVQDIPELEMHEAGNVFLENHSDNPDALTPQIFDIRPPAELPTVTLGPIMRQHRQYLKLNHDITEHHAYLAEVRSQQQTKLDAVVQGVATLTQQNHERGETQNQFAATIAEMSFQNAGRDQAIAALQEMFHATLTQMSERNAARDQALAKINAVLAEMSQVNLVRDQAIDDLCKRLWFVPKSKSKQ
jgi:hypothetical protein